MSEEKTAAEPAEPPQAPPPPVPEQALGEAQPTPEQAFGEAPSTAAAPSVPHQSLGEAPAAAAEPSLADAPEPADAEPPAPAESPPTAPVPPTAPAPPTAPVPSTAPAPPTTPAEQSLGAAPVAAETLGEAPAKKKGKILALVGGIVAVLLVIVIAAVIAVKFISGDPTRDVTAGACLADLPIVAVGEDKEANRTRVVECTDSAATHKVEARLNDRTLDEARSPEICKDFPNTTFSYRAIPDGGRGYVLCLSELKK